MCTIKRPDADTPNMCLVASLWDAASMSQGKMSIGECSSEPPSLEGPSMQTGAVTLMAYGGNSEQFFALFWTDSRAFD